MDERTRRIGEAIAAYERDGPAALDQACTESPELATDIRGAVAALELLRGAGGILDDRGAGASSTISVGSVVGHFRIVAQLGHGGMGRVYRARDIELDREVALKVVLLPFLTPEEALTRIRREARLIAQVRHDNIVGVHEVGQTRDGLPYFVMDLIEGTPLSRVLAGLGGRSPAGLTGADLFSGVAEGPASRGTDSYPAAVARLLLPIAEALEAAHAVGVVHRDVKPSNILVDRQGRPHLVDFGIARETDAASLTSTGLSAGTPPYMAPEQIEGGKSGIGLVTAATDVYALGVTLYQALTLHMPFQGDSVARTMWLIMHVDPRPLRTLNPNVSVDLDTICRSALEKAPHDRYAGAGEFADDLRRYLEHRPISRRPVGRLGRLQRYVRHNPWPVTAVAASVLTLFLLAYGLVSAAFDRRIESLKNKAYEFVTTRDGDLAEFGRVVDELNELAPHMSEVRDFNLVVADKLSQHEADIARLRASKTLAEARALADAGRPEDTARIESLYVDCLADLNAWVALRPEQAPSEPGFEAAFDFRRTWLERSLLSGRAGDVADGATRLVLHGTPQGADVHLLRYELQSALVAGGEERLVPVPMRRRAGGRPGEFEASPTAVRPGSEVLVVEAVEDGTPGAASGLRRGDLVLEVAGRPFAGAVVTLPCAERTQDPGPTKPPWSRLVRLGLRDVHEELDVDIVTLETAIGEERLAEFIEPGGAAWSTTLRRTHAGFDPAPCSLRAALEGPLPPGGVELVVATGAVSRNVTLQGHGRSGLRLTTTCYPVIADESNRIGSLPLELDDLPAGSWLLVLRAPGFEDLRLPVALSPGQRAGHRVDLLPEGTTPAGLVVVPAGPFLAGAAGGSLPGDETAWPSAQRWLDTYWIGRTEVTVAEYQEFLHHELTQETIRKGEVDRTYARVPRLAIIDMPAGSTCRPIWEKRDGLYVFSGDPQLPVKGISCVDADEYCRWRTRVTGGGWTFRLPTEAEWEKAARGVDGRACPWGDALEPGFAKCELAHADLPSLVSDEMVELLYEPVNRSTRDESPFGLRDAAGNVLEWCAGESHRELPFRRPWRGGFARALGGADLMCARRGDGYPDRISDNDGFRIIAWRRPWP